MGHRKFLGQIPQVSHTYNVVGNMNEHQLAIGETTYGGRSELHHQPGAIIDYGSLIYLTLQRAKNAREAIVVMTGLVEKYGYYSEGESFSISDPDEVWIMEMIGKGEGEKGAVWVARMVPDGYVCAHANQARITTFPLESRESISSDKIKNIYNKDITTVYAKDVISFAKLKGFYPQDAKTPNSASQIPMPQWISVGPGLVKSGYGPSSTPFIPICPLTGITPKEKSNGMKKDIPPIACPYGLSPTAK